MDMLYCKYVHMWTKIKWLEQKGKKQSHRFTFTLFMIIDGCNSFCHSMWSHIFFKPEKHQNLMQCNLCVVRARMLVRPYVLVCMRITNNELIKFMYLFLLFDKIYSVLTIIAGHIHRYYLYKTIAFEQFS